MTANGHTGNNTNANIPTIRPIIRPFLEIVVSNLKEQNLDYGSFGCAGYKVCGYFRDFDYVGLRKYIKFWEFYVSSNNYFIVAFASILSFFNCFILLKSSYLKYSTRFCPTRAYLNGNPYFFKNLTKGMNLFLWSCIICLYFYILRRCYYYSFFCLLSAMLWLFIFINT